MRNYGAKWPKHSTTSLTLLTKIARQRCTNLLQGTKKLLQATTQNPQNACKTTTKSPMWKSQAHCDLPASFCCLCCFFPHTRPTLKSHQCMYRDSWDIIFVTFLPGHKKASCWWKTMVPNCCMLMCIGMCCTQSWGFYPAPWPKYESWGS
jgi:hypothetical protein